jgi:tetratricopeptide (TPR) repeat protein
MSPFTTTRRVEFGDTDMAGIMHFANFFRFMEAAETSFLIAQTAPFNERGPKHKEFAAGAAEAITGLELIKTRDLYARAWLLREAGSTAAAAKAYEAVLRNLPEESVEWRLELAQLLFEMGDIEGAERNLRQVLRDRPDLSGAKELNASLVRTRTKSRP